MRSTILITQTLILFVVVLLIGCSTQSQTPTPSFLTQEESNRGFLTGDVAARYEALPPAYKTALNAYAAYYGVSPALVPSVIEDKIEQWGDNAVPLDELIDAERAQRFRDRGIFEEHADLLSSGYVYLLISDIEPERRVELMNELARDPVGEARAAMGDEPDSQSGSLTWFDPPSYEKVLTQTALDRMDLLGPGIKEGLFDARNSANDGSMQSREMATWITAVEIFLLRVEPGFEVSELSTHLTDDARDAFNAMSADGQSLAVETHRNMRIIDAVTTISLLGRTKTDFVQPPSVSDAELAGEAESIIEWASAVDAHRRANP